MRIFAYPTIFATPFGRNRVGHAKRPPVLFDGLAVAIGLFKEADVVLHLFVVWILAPGSCKLCMRALVVAAQNI